MTRQKSACDVAISEPLRFCHRLIQRAVKTRPKSVAYVAIFEPVIKMLSERVMTWKLFFELYSVVFLTLSIGNLRCVVKSRSFCITFILSCYVVFHVVEVEISSLQFQTALVALIAFFMPTSPTGALGSDDYPKEE